MPLSPGDKEKAKLWVAGKWRKDPACAICGENQWSVSEEIVAPVNQDKTGLNLGGRTYPQFMVICMNCGYTHYFNALIAGVVEKDPDEDQDGGASGNG